MESGWMHLIHIFFIFFAATPAFGIYYKYDLCRSEISYLSPHLEQYDLSTSSIYFPPSQGDEFHTKKKCVDGSWPLNKFCEFTNQLLWVEKDLRVFLLDNYAQGEDKLYFLSPAKNSPKCRQILNYGVIIEVPYNLDLYQSDGSNYYVIHVDVLIPLWQLMKVRYEKNNRSPITVVLFVRSEFKIDLYSKAFLSRNSYWIASLQLILPNEIIFLYNNDSISRGKEHLGLSINLIKIYKLYSKKEEMVWFVSVMPSLDCQLLIFRRRK